LGKAIGESNQFRNEARKKIWGRKEVGGDNQSLLGEKKQTSKATEELSVGTLEL